jgi:hypothetical protein
MRSENRRTLPGAAPLQIEAHLGTATKTGARTFLSAATLNW